MPYIDLSETVHDVKVGLIVIAWYTLTYERFLCLLGLFGSAFPECVFWSAKVSTERRLNLGFRTQTVSLSPE